MTGRVLSLLSNVFTVGVTGGTLTPNYVGGTITVGGVGMTITAVNTTNRSVTVDALADIPFELVDDDTAALPQLPDTSLMEEKYQPAYILPVVDGGGNPANNKTNVPFKLNMQTDTTPLVNTELMATNALESDGNRANDFWIGYALSAYQGSPYSTVIQRGDNDSDVEPALGGIASGTGLGVIIFTEELRDEEQELGITETAATVAHEIAHLFGLRDCGTPTSPCDTTINDMMGGAFYLPGSRFRDSDLNILRSRIASPGR